MRSIHALRLLSVILLAAAESVWSAAYAGDQDPLPPEAAKAVAEREVAVAAAKSLYDAMIARANADAVKKLAPVVTKLTKAGDLKGATAVQAKVEEWTPKSVEALSKMALGRWRIDSTKNNGVSIVISKDRSASWGGKMNGTWEDKGDRLIVKWANGIVYEVTNGDQGLKFVELNGKAELSGGALVKVDG